MIANGSDAARDRRINPDSDRRFLEVLLANRLRESDSWDQDELVKQAGSGSMELHTWIAAAAPHGVISSSPLTLGIYTVAEELGIAAAIVHAD